MKVVSVCVLAIVSTFLLTANSLSQNRASSNSAPVASFEKKLQHIQSNAERRPPDSTPTEFSEQEINAYFASGNIDLPAGVQSVALQEQPGIVIGTSRVDFDQLKTGKNSYNPLLSVFSGVHDVVATAHAYGAKREGFVHVDSVSIDGVEVPAIRSRIVRAEIPQTEIPERRHRFTFCPASPCGRGDDWVAQGHSHTAITGTQN